MTRLAVVILLTATTGVAIVTHHHPRRPAPVQSAVRVPAHLDLPRASRAWGRQPLAGRQQRRFTAEGATPMHRRAPVRRLGPSRPAWATAPHGARPAPGSGSLDITAYCSTGHTTASGKQPERGMAAGNRWPFGTVLHIDGYGDVTIEDRIGWSSDVDIYFGDSPDCEQRASAFGRQHRRVSVVR